MNIKRFQSRMQEAVANEREEEMARHLNEIRRLTGKQREEKGRALVAMRKRKAGTDLNGDMLYRFYKADQEVLPDIEIKVGDVVLLSQYNPLDKRNPQGTVHEVTKGSVVISVKDKLRFDKKKYLRIDLYVNDVTFKRMQTALKALNNNEGQHVADLLRGKVDDQIKSMAITDVAELNNSQKQAVQMAFDAKHIGLIQGPPGTGKTTVAAAYIQNEVKRGSRVLVTADSNGAVDHIIRQLLGKGLNIVRVGNPIRVNADLLSETLDMKLAQHPQYIEAQAEKEKAAPIREEQQGHKRPEMRYLRGLRYEEIQRLRDQGRSTRGIPFSVIESMAAWCDLGDEINKIYDKAKSMELEAIRSIFDAHPVVCTTNSTAGADIMCDHKFDVVVVDEATQSTVPSTLISLLKAKKAVLIGDQKQLPPTVKSQKAKKLDFDRSLFEMLASDDIDNFALLNVQYRMNNSILKLSNDLFYDGRVESDVANACWSLENHSAAVTFVDVAGIEVRYGDNSSYFNQEEVDAVQEIYHMLLAENVTAERIGIISPYKLQAEKIRKTLKGAVEVDTVDAYQGREKDVVILSLVRCNSEGKLGFLKDYRRLNVAITRAKKKLYIVGHRESLSVDMIYNKLICDALAMV